MDPDSSGASRNGAPGAPPSARGLRVAVVDRLGCPVRAPGLALWLAQVAPPALHGEVTVALVSDAVIRTLNRRFRGKHSATDVLSFPDAAPLVSRAGVRAARQPTAALGDIVISTDTARRQARSGGHSFAVELKILALHGLLHLLGYDHDSPSDRGRMALAERRLRARGGLRESLIDRANTRAGSRERRTPAPRRTKRRVGKSERRGPSENR